MSETEIALLGIKIEGKKLLLGSGSWGEVHKVKIEHDGVSLVQAAKRFFTMPSNISKFLKEYTELEHKNIIPVLEVRKCNDTGIPVIVMELMEFNLAAMLQRHLDLGQDIPMQSKLSMLCDVSAGLNYLHAHCPPIIHGNLHSKNIFLTSTLIAKIGDFVPSNVPKKSGSPFSPLTITSDHPTPSLDVFAFGCVVCHVITQQLPVPNGTSSNEVQLRKCYIDQINLEILKQLVIISLDNNSEDRPLISLVYEKMNSLMNRTINITRGKIQERHTVDGSHYNVAKCPLLPVTKSKLAIHA